MKTLNPQQQTAVHHGTGPLLIIAGAGTGKTTVVTERIVKLISEDDVPTESVLALTFTEKAASEMEERVEARLPLGYLDLNITTFHAFAADILRDYGLDYGLPGDFKLLTEVDAWVLVRKNLATFDLDYYKPRGNPTKFISVMLSHFSRLKDELISVEEYKGFAESLENGEISELSQISPNVLASSLQGEAAVRAKKKQDTTNKTQKNLKPQTLNIEDEVKRLREIAGAYKTYQQLLLDEGALDFGDLMFYFYKLLQDRPLIREKLQKQFQHILVDEFQDVNIAQYEMVKILAQPGNNLTVVGDDDQSIYRFRGASVSNLMAFTKDYPKAKQVVLTENYRSGQRILGLAYEFIQHNNPDRLEAHNKSV